METNQITAFFIGPVHRHITPFEDVGLADFLIPKQYRADARRTLVLHPPTNRAMVSTAPSGGHHLVQSVIEQSPVV